MSEAPKRPATEILPVAEELVRHLAPFCHRIEIAGSLRRQARQVSDIDLLAIPKVEHEERPIKDDLFGQKEMVSVNRLWEALDKMLGGHYVQGGQKSRWFIAPRETVQVQISTCEAGNWGNLLVIRTGPWQFSKHVVTCLARAGHPSHEGWVRDAPDSIRTNWSDAELLAMPKLQTPTEERVFELARIPYRLPHQRGE